MPDGEPEVTSSAARGADGSPPVGESVGPTRVIAEHLAKLRFENLPDQAVTNAKTAILDTIGVTLAGCTTETGRLIQRYVQSAQAAERATVFADGRKTSPELAALANGVLAHVLDFDDRGHASTHTLPAALALGEVEDVDGCTLLLAYIVGRELRLHLDEVFRPGRGGVVDSVRGGGPGWRGWHETGVLGTLAAAAAAGKVLAFDAETMDTALGIAGSLASGLMANFGTSTKSLHAGNAARNGVLAASLARDGFTAHDEILTARRGFVEAISYPDQRDVGSVARSIQEWFQIVERGVRIKPYPSCTGTHQFIELMRSLRGTHGLVADDAVEVVIGRVIGATPKRDYPRDELECKFSPAFVAIATLVDGALTLENCTREFLYRDDVQALLARTRYEDAERGFVRVCTRDGQVYEEHAPPSTATGGSPARDLETTEEIRAKFHGCADRVVGPERADRIEQMVDSLETLASVRELTALVAV